MKKLGIVFLVVQLLCLKVQAQFRMSPADSLRRDSINKATQQDYKNMLGSSQHHFYTARAIGQSASC